MPFKRKRIVAEPSKTSSLRPTIQKDINWSWIGSEVNSQESITLEHCKIACNLSQRNKNAFCSNIYSLPFNKTTPSTPVHSTGNGGLEDDVIIILDDDEPVCSKKTCRTNPFCLNYLGQDKWENGDTTQAFYSNHRGLGVNPSLHSRKDKLPVGLKNLGATCYANASLQVWYRDLTFRAGVFACESPDDNNSPIFQLQVTFATLQDGNKASFNPEKLVESLQLRITEQQDAQEFSKLFMSHLDEEFQKQSNPSVRSLVEDQFQGSQVYGTICHTCGNKSERISNFLEIEIGVEKKSTLEDQILATLKPEILSGDNKYLCSRCESLQDATRYTELHKLPPILHFSLLRFVYDVSTMERKKCKHSITFPLSLDMKKFLGSEATLGTAEAENSDKDLYELRGILLHKGASAYYGHYEAQVYDTENGVWFQCNDETITHIKTLGDPCPKEVTHEITEITDDDMSNSSQPYINGRKRRRVSDSDDEVVEAKPRASHILRVTSRDAYMLIYSRKEPVTTDSKQEDLREFHLKPPGRVMDVVRSLNEEHDVTCRDFRARESLFYSKLDFLRQKVKVIYSNWTTTPLESDSFVVSRQALEEWMSHKCIESVVQELNWSRPSENQSPTQDIPPIAISASHIVCEHGLLDPLRAKDFKCIRQISYNLIRETGCVFQPLLRTTDVCRICVSSIFQEKLYNREHPKLTRQFHEISFVSDDDIGYWISKRWCKDWKLVKPRMHVFSRQDPPPDSLGFYNDVYCQHDHLTVDTTNRWKISSKAVELLNTLFPNWKPPSSATRPCTICDVQLYSTRADKKEIYKKAEEEKMLLAFMSQSSLETWSNDSRLSSFAVVPTQFIKDWNRWINNPLNTPKPQSVDNTAFICKHGLLLFDPNSPRELDSRITIVKQDQWIVLSSQYRADPLIELTKGNNNDHYGHSLAICEECCLRTKIEWETTDIFIRLGGPGGEASSKDIQPNLMRNYVQQSEGVRQSRRLRRRKEQGGWRKISVAKSTSVKDIKILASEEFNIPTICQRLFYQGRELNNNDATAETLEILSHDIIDVEETKEVIEIGFEDDQGLVTEKRKETAGFGGTLLGSWSSSPEKTPTPRDVYTCEKSCHMCTYANNFNASSCEMCKAILVQ